MGYPMAAFPFLEVPLPLSTHTIRTDKVRLSKDNDFEVRAVTFPDLAMLVHGRLPDLIAIVSKYQESQASVKRGVPVDRKTMTDLAIMVARDFPTLAMEMISSCVYGETMTDEMRDKIAALPVPIQLDALSKIAKLTVEEAGGLGNLLSDLRQRLQKAGAGEGGPMATLETQNV